MSNLICRNITLPDGRTSIRLDPTYWEAIAEICWRENITPGDIAVRATKGVDECSRTSAIRCYILRYFREAATPAGHSRADHGELRPEDA